MATLGLTPSESAQLASAENTLTNAQKNSTALATQATDRLLNSDMDAYAGKVYADVQKQYVDKVANNFKYLQEQRARAQLALDQRKQDFFEQYKPVELKISGQNADTNRMNALTAMENSRIKERRLDEYEKELLRLRGEKQALSGSGSSGATSNKASSNKATPNKATPNKANANNDSAYVSAGSDPRFFNPKTEGAVPSPAQVAKTPGVTLTKAQAEAMGFNEEQAQLFVDNIPAFYSDKKNKDVQRKEFELYSRQLEQDLRNAGVQFNRAGLYKWLYKYQKDLGLEAPNSYFSEHRGIFTATKDAVARAGAGLLDIPSAVLGLAGWGSKSIGMDTLGDALMSGATGWQKNVTGNFKKATVSDESLEGEEYLTQYSKMLKAIDMGYYDKDGNPDVSKLSLSDTVGDVWSNMNLLDTAANVTGLAFGSKGMGFGAQTGAKVGAKVGAKTGIKSGVDSITKWAPVAKAKNLGKNISSVNALAQSNTALSKFAKAMGKEGWSATAYFTGLDATSRKELVNSIDIRDVAGTKHYEQYMDAMSAEQKLKYLEAEEEGGSRLLQSKYATTGVIASQLGIDSPEAFIDRVNQHYADLKDKGQDKAFIKVLQNMSPDELKATIALNVPPMVLQMYGADIDTTENRMIAGADTSAVTGNADLDKFLIGMYGLRGEYKVARLALEDYKKDVLGNEMLDGPSLAASLITNKVLLSTGNSPFAQFMRGNGLSAKGKAAVAATQPTRMGAAFKGVGDALYSAGHGAAFMTASPALQQIELARNTNREVDTTELAEHAVEGAILGAGGVAVREASPYAKQYGASAREKAQPYLDRLRKTDVVADEQVSVADESVEPVVGEASEIPQYRHQARIIRDTIVGAGGKGIINKRSQAYADATEAYEELVDLSTQLETGFDLDGGVLSDSQRANMESMFFEQLEKFRLAAERLNVSVKRLDDINPARPEEQAREQAYDEVYDERSYEEVPFDELPVAEERVVEQAPVAEERVVEQTPVAKKKKPSARKIYDDTMTEVTARRIANEVAPERVAEAQEIAAKEIAERNKDLAEKSKNLTSIKLGDTEELSDGLVKELSDRAEEYAKGLRITIDRNASELSPQAMKSLKRALTIVEYNRDLLREELIARDGLEGYDETQEITEAVSAKLEKRDASRVEDLYTEELTDVENISDGQLKQLSDKAKEYSNRFKTMLNEKALTPKVVKELRSKRDIIEKNLDILRDEMSFRDAISSRIDTEDKAPVKTTVKTAKKAVPSRADIEKELDNIIATVRARRASEPPSAERVAEGISVSEKTAEIQAAVEKVLTEMGRDAERPSQEKIAEIQDTARRIVAEYEKEVAEKETAEVTTDDIYSKEITDVKNIPDEQVNELADQAEAYAKGLNDIIDENADVTPPEALKELEKARDFAEKNADKLREEKTRREDENKAEDVEKAISDEYEKIDDLKRPREVERYIKNLKSRIKTLKHRKFNLDILKEDYRRLHGAKVDKVLEDAVDVYAYTYADSFGNIGYEKIRFDKDGILVDGKNVYVSPDERKKGDFLYDEWIMNDYLSAAEKHLIKLQKLDKASGDLPPKKAKEGDLGDKYSKYIQGEESKIDNLTSVEEAEKYYEQVGARFEHLYEDKERLGIVEGYNKLYNAKIVASMGDTVAVDGVITSSNTALGYEYRETFNKNEVIVDGDNLYVSDQELSRVNEEMSGAFMRGAWSLMEEPPEPKDNNTYEILKYRDRRAHAKEPYRFVTEEEILRRLYANANSAVDSLKRRASAKKIEGVPTKPRKKAEVPTKPEKKAEVPTKPEKKAEVPLKKAEVEKKAEPDVVTDLGEDDLPWLEDDRIKAEKEAEKARKEAEAKKREEEIRADNEARAARMKEIKNMTPEEKAAEQKVFEKLKGDAKERAETFDKQVMSETKRAAKLVEEGNIVAYREEILNKQEALSEEKESRDITDDYVKLVGAAVEKETAKAIRIAAIAGDGDYSKTFPVYMWVPKRVSKVVDGDIYLSNDMLRNKEAEIQEELHNAEALIRTQEDLLRYFKITADIHEDLLRRGGKLPETPILITEYGRDYLHKEERDLVEAEIEAARKDIPVSDEHKKRAAEYNKQYEAEMAKLEGLKTKEDFIAYRDEADNKLKELQKERQIHAIPDNYSKLTGAKIEEETERAVRISALESEDGKVAVPVDLWVPKRATTTVGDDLYILNDIKIDNDLVADYDTIRQFMESARDGIFVAPSEKKETTFKERATELLKNYKIDKERIPNLKALGDFKHYIRTLTDTRLNLIKEKEQRGVPQSFLKLWGAEVEKESDKAIRVSTIAIVGDKHRHVTIWVPKKTSKVVGNDIYIAKNMKDSKDLDLQGEYEKLADIRTHEGLVDVFKVLARDEAATKLNDADLANLDKYIKQMDGYTVPPETLPTEKKAEVPLKKAEVEKKAEVPTKPEKKAEVPTKKPIQFEQGEKERLSDGAAPGRIKATASNRFDEKVGDALRGAKPPRNFSADAKAELEAAKKNVENLRSQYNKNMNRDGEAKQEDFLALRAAVEEMDAVIDQGLKEVSVSKLKLTDRMSDRSLNVADTADKLFNATTLSKFKGLNPTEYNAINTARKSLRAATTDYKAHPTDKNRKANVVMKHNALLDAIEGLKKKVTVEQVTVEQPKVEQVTAEQPKVEEPVEQLNQMVDDFIQKYTIDERIPYEKGSPQLRLKEALKTIEQLRDDYNKSPSDGLYADIERVLANTAEYAYKNIDTADIIARLQLPDINVSRSAFNVDGISAIAERVLEVTAPSKLEGLREEDVQYISDLRNEYEKAYKPLLNNRKTITKLAETVKQYVDDIKQLIGGKPTDSNKEQATDSVKTTVSDKEQAKGFSTEEKAEFARQRQLEEEKKAEAAKAAAEARERREKADAAGYSLRRQITNTIMANREYASILTTGKYLKNGKAKYATDKEKDEAREKLEAVVKWAKEVREDFLSDEMTLDALRELTNRYEKIIKSKPKATKEMSLKELKEYEGKSDTIADQRKKDAAIVKINAWLEEIDDRIEEASGDKKAQDALVAEAEALIAEAKKHGVSKDRIDELRDAKDSVRYSLTQYANLSEVRRNTPLKAPKGYRFATPLELIEAGHPHNTEAFYDLIKDEVVLNQSAWDAAQPIERAWVMAHENFHRFAQSKFGGWLLNWQRNKIKKAYNANPELRKMVDYKTDLYKKVRPKATEDELWWEAVEEVVADIRGLKETGNIAEFERRHGGIRLTYDTASKLISEKDKFDLAYYNEFAHKIREMNSMPPKDEELRKEVENAIGHAMNKFGDFDHAMFDLASMKASEREAMYPSIDTELVRYSVGRSAKDVVKDLITIPDSAVKAKGGAKFNHPKALEAETVVVPMGNLEAFRKGVELPIDDFNRLVPSNDSTIGTLKHGGVVATIERGGVSADGNKVWVKIGQVSFDPTKLYLNKPINVAAFNELARKNPMVAEDLLKMENEYAQARGKYSLADTGRNWLQKAKRAKQVLEGGSYNPTYAKLTSNYERVMFRTTKMDEAPITAQGVISGTARGILDTVADWAAVRFTDHRRKTKRLFANIARISTENGVKNAKQIQDMANDLMYAMDTSGPRRDGIIRELQTEFGGDEIALSVRHLVDKYSKEKNYHEDNIRSAIGDYLAAKMSISATNRVIDREEGRYMRILELMHDDKIDLDFPTGEDIGSTLNKLNLQRYEGSRILADEISRLARDAKNLPMPSGYEGKDIFKTARYFTNGEKTVRAVLNTLLNAQQRAIRRIKSDFNMKLEYSTIPGMKKATVMGYSKAQAEAVIETVSARFDNDPELANIARHMRTAAGFMLATEIEFETATAKQHIAILDPRNDRPKWQNKVLLAERRLRKAVRNVKADDPSSNKELFQARKEYVNLTKTDYLPGYHIEDTGNMTGTVGAMVGHMTFGGEHLGGEPYDAYQTFFNKVERVAQNAAFREIGEKIADLVNAADRGHSGVGVTFRSGITVTDKTPERTRYLTYINNGKPWHIVFDSPDVMKSFSGEDIPKKLPLLDDTIGRATRFLAVSYTANPIFQMKQLVKDTQERATSLLGKTIYDKNGNILDSAKLADEALINLSFHQLDNLNKLLMAGKYVYDTEVDFGKLTPEQHRYLNIMETLDRYGGLSTRNKDLFDFNPQDFDKLGKQSTHAEDMAHRVFGAILNMNNATEMFASANLFDVLVKNGVDEKRAAAYTLDTANFRKAGTWANNLKSFFPFVQSAFMGGGNLLNTMVSTSIDQGTGIKKRQLNAKGLIYLGKLTALYAMYNSWSMAMLGQETFEDDDGNEIKVNRSALLPSYSQSNLVTPIGSNGQYVNLPVAWGMHKTALGLANMMTNAYRHDRGWGEQVETTLDIALSSNVQPINLPPTSLFHNDPAKYLALVVTPDAFKPITQVGLNTNNFGTTIYKQFPNDKGLLHLKEAHNLAEGYKQANNLLYKMSGIDLHPRQFKTVWDGYFGGGLLGDATSIMYADFYGEHDKGIWKRYRPTADRDWDRETTFRVDEFIRDNVAIIRKGDSGKELTEQEKALYDTVVEYRKIDNSLNSQYKKAYAIEDEEAQLEAVEAINARKNMLNRSMFIKIQEFK